jgi:predicted aldo/keto reductase-like oxidoreductase
MNAKGFSRRQFLRGTVAGTAAVLAGGQVLGAEGAKRTAVDLVPLGKSGLKICRLGVGTGSNGGKVQRDLGQEGFTRLIRHAYDQGVTFIDTADMYSTHEMVREAIKGLPREKLWIQTKMRWEPVFPKDPWEVLNRFRKELGVDYIDSLLIHCATQSTWPQDLKLMEDVFGEAKQKKAIRLHGVSCHGLPALRAATKNDWVDVHLCRVNPQGKRVDGLTSQWDAAGRTADAFAEIKAMHDKGRGVIGMKICGNGEFKSSEEREKSVRFAMICGFVDAVAIGFASPKEIDEVIGLMNKGLEA